MDVKSLKLDSGQEIVSKVEEDDTYYILEKPVTILVNQQGLGFGPLFFSSEDENFKINKNKVVCVGDTIKQVKDQYLQAISGLSIADSVPSNLKI